MSSIFLPLMPPRSLKYVTASIRPWAMSLPWSEVGPVRSTRLPILMTPCASPGGAPRPTTNRPTRTNRTSRSRAWLMGPSFGALVRIRPELPVAADPEPDAGQALRLVHQGQGDCEAEDEVPGRGEYPDGSPADHRQGRSALLWHLPHHGHSKPLVDLP